MSVRVSVRVIKIAPAILFFAGAFHPLLVQTNQTHKMKTNKKNQQKHHTVNLSEPISPGEKKKREKAELK